MTIVYWLVTFVQEILDSFRKHPIDIRAQAVAFSFYVAIFPFISLFYEVVDQLDDRLSMIHLEPSISFLFPSSIGSNIFSDTVNHGYNSQSIWTILLSVVMLLYFTSKGMVMLIRAMNKVENHYESWGYFRNKSVGFGLTMMLLTSIVLLFGLNAYALQQSSTFHSILSGLAKFALLVFNIAVIHRYGSSIKQKERFFSPGTFLTAIGLFVLSLIYSWIQTHFFAHKSVGGIIGQNLSLLLWLYFCATFVLLGHDINDAIAQTRAKHATKRQ